jgi:hypothetical protein
LENNNTRSHSNTCGFWRENEVRLPLMNDSGEFGFFGPEAISRESVLWREGMLSQNFLWFIKEKT